MVTVKQLGDTIRTKRLLNNLSLDELARQVGISKPTLIEIEKGNSSCSIGTYFKLLSLLKINLSVDELLKSKSRKRASRRNLQIEKMMNQFVVLCVENYSYQKQISPGETYSLLKTSGVLDLLYNDYEDLHGMSSEYLNQFIEVSLKGVTK